MTHRSKKERREGALNRRQNELKTLKAGGYFSDGSPFNSIERDNKIAAAEKDIENLQRKLNPSVREADRD